MQSVLFLAFKSHTGTAHFGHAETVKGTAYANKNKKLYPLPLSAINDGKGLVTQNPGY